MRASIVSLFLVSMTAVVVAACGDGEGDGAPDAAFDAAAPADGGFDDSDGGVPTDGGPTPDGGPSPDGGGGDAGMPAGGPDLLFDVAIHAPGLVVGTRYVDDLDGDGLRDAVRIGRHPSDPDLQRVTLLVSRPAGFEERDTLDLTSFGVDLGDVADFDGDGTRDLALLRRHSTGRFWVIAYGAGDGTIARQEEIEGRGDLAGFADFNDDGRRDVALRRQDGLVDDIAIWMSDPAGGARTFVDLGRSFGDGPFVSGDFDGDGRLDLFELPSRIYLQRASGFDPTPIDVPGCTGCESAAVADLNADGRDDVVGADEDRYLGGELRILVANADGTLSDHAQIDVAQPRAVTIGDVDADGALDLVVSDGFGFAAGGAPILEVLYGDGLDFTGDRRRYANYPAWEKVRVEDHDGDGRPDLLVDDRFVAYGGPGRALRAPVVSSWRGTVSGIGPFMGRFDADALPDALVLLDGGDVEYRALRADRTLADVVTCSHPGPRAANRLFDVTGDGRLDALHFAADALDVWVNRDGCDLAPVATSDLAASRYGTSAADLTGDGTPELMWRTASTVEVAVGLGDGAFEAARTSASTAPWGALHAGLLDGDGHVDLLSVSTDGDAFTVFLGDGAGGLAEGATTSVPGLREAHAGDVDGDGDLDVVTVTDSGTGETLLALYRNAGDATFAAPAPLTTLGPFLDQVRVADLDGDGADELLTIDGSFARVWRVAGAVEERFAFPFTELVQIVDADDDGDLDLVVHEDRSGRHIFSVIRNRSVD